MNHIAIEYSVASKVAHDYYKEGFRRGLMFGLATSSLVITGLLLFFSWFTR